MQDTQFRSLDGEDPLEATHSSILDWKIPWTEEPGRATVHGITEEWVRHDLVTKQQQTLLSSWIIQVNTDLFPNWDF